MLGVTSQTGICMSQVSMNPLRVRAADTHREYVLTKTYTQGAL